MPLPTPQFFVAPAVYTVCVEVVDDYTQYVLSHLKKIKTIRLINPCSCCYMPASNNMLGVLCGDHIYLLEKEVRNTALSVWGKQNVLWWLHRRGEWCTTITKCTILIRSCSAETRVQQVGKVYFTDMTVTINS